MTTAVSPLGESRTGGGRAAPASAAAAALTGLVLTYAVAPAHVVAALVPGRMLVLACVVALLGAGFERVAAAGSCALERLGARPSAAARAAAVAVVVIAGWWITGVFADARDLPAGFQIAAEALFVPCCLTLMVAAAWVGARAAGSDVRWTVLLARHAAPAFLVLALALRGDMARFSLLSLPVRTYLAAMLGGAGGLAACLAALDGRRRAVRGLSVAALAAAAAGALWFDATCYRNTYPEMHLAAWTGAVLCAAAVAGTWARHAAGSPARLFGTWIVVVAAVAATAVASADDVLRTELFRHVGPLGRTARVSGLWLGPWIIGTPAPQFDPQPGSPAVPVATPPCVVLVTVDALRADRLVPGKMPFASAWALRGARFESARTVYPGTHPTFGSLFSGRYTSGEVPDDGVVVEAFRAAGYRTIAIGGLGRHGYVRGRFDVIEGPRDRDDAWSGARFSALLAESARGGPPVFAWVHLDRPHAPYAPSVRPPRAGPVDLYDACVADTDAVLGGVLAAADALAAARPAVTVLFADHGEEFGEHGGEYHLSSVYDAQLRVPLVLAGPGIPAAVHRDPVSLFDVGPTLLQAAGLAVPDGLHGRSLLPVTQGAAPADRPLISVLRDARSGRFAWTAVVFGRWKLVADSVAGTLGLFRPDDDPLERVNLIGDASSAPPELFRALSLTPPR